MTLAPAIHFQQFLDWALTVWPSQLIKCCVFGTRCSNVECVWFADVLHTQSSVTHTCEWPWDVSKRLSEGFLKSFTWNGLLLRDFTFWAQSWLHVRAAPSNLFLNSCTRMQWQMLHGCWNVMAVQLRCGEPVMIRHQPARNTYDMLCCLLSRDRETVLGRQRNEIQIIDFPL